MRGKVEAGLRQSGVPDAIAEALLEAHFELKEAFFFGKFRPSELEAGRFTEAAIRVVQHLAKGQHSPLSKPLPPFDDVVKELERLPGTIHDSLRIHIPRTLWAVYGVRNRRNVGHIGGDVNPNRPDANFVMTCCDWVLAELVRLTFKCLLAEAQAIVDGLVELRLPVIQEINGFPKLLDTSFSVPQRILAQLYRRGSLGASVEELREWLKKVKGPAFSMALVRLEHDKAFIHRDGDQTFITASGAQQIEAAVLSSQSTSSFRT